MQVAHYSNHQAPRSRKRASSRTNNMRRHDSSFDTSLRRQRADTATASSSTGGALPRLQDLEDAVRKELRTINGQEELFLRATSDLSKLLRDITYDHGRSYFRYVLRDVFGDRSAIYTNANSSAAMSHGDVIAYATSIVKRMARAIHYAPLVLRASTQYVLREFQKSFPDCKCAEQIVVGSILFLRILCPALIKPEVFGFQPHTAKSLPVGVQIAKLLQSTLRGTLCSVNQPEGATSNDFIKAFHPFMETFLTRFPQLSSNVQAIQRPAHLARFGSWDTLETARSTPEMASSWRGHGGGHGAGGGASGGSSGSTGSREDLANRLRGMSMSTPDDINERKKKFSLKFW